MDSKIFWKYMRPFNRRLARTYLRGFGPQKLILLLTTTGRKTGRARTTPLQYEITGGTLFVASARGPQADWYRNILANPCVQVQIGPHAFQATALPIAEPTEIADFLALRLERHPVMIRMIMCLFEGLPWRFTRSDLEAFAAEKTLVAIPYGGNDVNETGSEEAL